MNACSPCPAAVRHVARAIRRHVLRPIGRRVHYVWHHAPRVIAYGCCIAAIGGLGGALVAPAGGFFPPAPAAYATAPGTQNIPENIPKLFSEAAGWPETPAYSDISSPGAITGGGVVQIPVYRTAPAPQFLSTQPNVYSTPRAPRMTSVPEPSAFALLLLPAAGMAMVRRRA